MRVGVQKRNMAQRMRLSLALALGAGWAAAMSAQTVPAARSCAAAQAVPAAASRIAGDWSAGPTVALAAAQIPAALQGADLGVAAPQMRLERILLLLKASDAQNSALDAQLAAMQTAGGCEFHQWRTAAQYADAFANSVGDVNAVAEWLRSEGFTVAPLPAGRGWIEFSGTAGQVEQALGAPVHAISTVGGTRYAVHDAVRIPSALAPLVQGLVSLDGALSTAAVTGPELSGVSATRQMGMPASVAAQLGLSSVRDADGSGQAIAIAARSEVNAQDVAAFRSANGLAASALQGMPAGSDPGVTADQAAATAMASWAGAAAPGAQVVVVPAASTAATDGVDLALAAIVDRQLAGTVVVGYSACEPELSAAHRAFYAALYRQAAAEGMSVIAASGDGGAAACHATGSEAPVTTGYAVNALASTPWNTAVGVAANGVNGELRAWSTTGTQQYSGGGGVSAAYPLPAWQPAVAGAEPGRMLPDVALPAAADASFGQGLAFCLSAGASAEGCTAMRSGGSALAAAMLGGVSARLAQKYGAQGNLAPGLYALRGDAGVFEDVQAGSAKLACVAGSPGCDASGQIGYDAATGFDLATGLGSIHADKLVSDWAHPDVTGTGAVTVNVTVTPAATNAVYNPTAQITFTATVTSQTGGGTPTGTVQFFDQQTNANLGSAATLGTNGTASVQVSSGLAQGGNNIVAIYSGDPTYAPLTSPATTVNIQPSSTTVTVTPSTTSPTVGQSFTATAAIAVGTPAAGATPPNGKVSLTVDGLANSTATLATANGATTASFTVTLAAGGTHSLQATYAGDTNYVTSTSSPVQLTVAKGATTTTVTAAPASLVAGTPETLTANVSVTGGGNTTVTGMISFYDGTTLLGTQPLVSNTATLGNLTMSTATAHPVTAVYSGDSNWATSTSPVVTLTAVLLSDTVTLTASPATPAPGQLVTLTATVAPTVPPTATGEQNPTGTVTFYQGTTALGSVGLTASLSNTAVATLTTAKLVAGQAQVTAVYSGDQFYSPVTSAALTVNVADFSLTPSPGNPATNLKVVKGQTGTASFVVTALGGFSGQVQVVCSSPTQADMNCTPSSQQVTPTATVSLSIQTFTTGGPAYGANRVPAWPGAAGGMALAGIVLLVLPVGRKRRLFQKRAQRWMLMALVLAGLCGAATGCGSVNGTLPSAAGTPLGVSTLTITATSYVDNVVVSHSVYLTVNVIPPA